MDYGGPQGLNVGDEEEAQLAHEHAQGVAQVRAEHHGLRVAHPAVHVDDQLVGYDAPPEVDVPDKAVEDLENGK
jgi:hypothetical protein